MASKGPSNLANVYWGSRVNEVLPRGMELSMGGGAIVEQETGSPTTFLSTAVVLTFHSSRERDSLPS